MVDIDGRKPSENVVDLRTSGGMTAGGVAGVGAAGALGVGLIGMGMWGVDETLCWLGLGTCSVSEERRIELDEFSKVILGDTERVWTSDFTARGETYKLPTLVFFDTPQPSACGAINPGQGPAYCNADERIYLDLGYFDRIASENDVTGDFPAAFIIAHEVAHHIQTQTGDFDRFLDAFLDPEAPPLNELQIRLELQADCIAGAWTKQADDAFGLLETGDIEEGITAASAFGADTVQEREQGFIVEAAFTHGTGEQRVRWFKKGLDSGDRDVCDVWTPALEDLWGKTPETPA